MKRLYPLSVLLFPSVASAQVLSQAAGLFNIIAGLMLVCSFLFFFGGLGMWAVRLGPWPTYRDEAIKLMAWGVTILITLAVLLAVVQFVQRHAAVASFVVGVCIVVFVAWMFVTLSQAKGGDEKGH